MDLGTGALFTMHGRVTTAVLAALGALQIFRWVGRRKLGMAYGLVWLGICAALVAVSVFPELLVALGRLAGSREPEGALRLAGFVFVAIVLLYLSLKVSALEAKLEALVQALALRQLPPNRDDQPAAPPYKAAPSGAPTRPGS
jgi:hypothetical protein